MRLKRFLQISLGSCLIFGLGMVSFGRFDATPALSLNMTMNPPMVIRQSGQASWYSRESPGINKRTANNEYFDDTEMTCAIWGVPFNQLIKVTNRHNGKSVVVRVNDRGPHFRYVRRGRIIDLTKAAFKKIANPKSGLIQVELEFL